MKIIHLSPLMTNDCSCVHCIFRSLNITMVLAHVNAVLADVSQTLGVSIPVVKFFTSMLAGYVFASVQLLLPRTGATVVKHVYCAACGIAISVFCFGEQCVYNLISILVSYVSFQILGTGLHNVLFTFFFQLLYLVGAYAVFASEGYDINWTTPQCMLCLKLIGLAWDCHDGRQKKEKLRAYQLESCYDGVPTLLELLGFSYFYGSFLAGPLFSFTRYLKFANGTLIDENAENRSRLFMACQKFIAAVLTFAFYSYYSPQFPCDYLLTDEFAGKPLSTKATVMMLTYHANFAKYVFTWMFAEGVIIISGLGYNGFSENADAASKWDALTNFKYGKFLFGPFFQDVLEGFNLTTNHWCGKYVFRRLAFLGNKTLSHITTMGFLAIWHGFYIGYVILFAIEFCYLTGERKLCENLNVLSGKTYGELALPLRVVIRVSSIVFRAYVCGFAAAAFMLLTWERIHVAYSQVYYWGVVMIAVELLFIVVTQQMANAKRRAEKVKEN